MKRFFLLLVLAGCSKTPSFSAQNRVTEAATIPVPSASTLAATPSVPVTPPPRPDCAAPSRLEKIGSVRGHASFSGELLATDAGKMLDPETFASVPPPPVDTRIERRGGASITPSRYRDIVNGRGLTSDTDAANVIVDLASGEKLLATDTCMQGRFEDGWLSSTGRFFFCHTASNGLQAWDLDAKRRTDEDAWMVGDGVIFTPGDTYAVAAATWIEDGVSRAGITYFDVDTHASKVVLDATMPIDPVSGKVTDPAVPFDVELCGDGDLFAATGDSEIAVFSGKDGAKLASAPSKEGGSISFSATGKYLSQNRGSSTTVYRLDL